MATPPLSTLTDRMRAATKQAHERSDRLVNLKLGFVITSRQLYGEALGLFAPIYDKLEGALERHRNDDDTQLRCVSALLDELRRAPGFEEDILFYLGEEGVRSMRKRQNEGTPPELVEYLDHLDRLEREDPVYLVVYVYHMYMAIMAGGYIIRKMVKRTMGLKGDEGVRALSFREGVDCRDLRRRLKLCINEDIVLDKDQQQKVLEESVQVFARNNKLVATIQDSHSFRSVVLKWKRWFMALCAVMLALAIAFFRRRE